MASRAGRLTLIALAAFDAAFLLGFVFSAFHHPVGLVATPLIAVGLEPAVARWSRRRVLVAIGLGLVLMIPFIISPTYLGRLF